MHDKNRQIRRKINQKNPKQSNPFTNEGFWLEDHFGTQAQSTITGKASSKTKRCLYDAALS